MRSRPKRTAASAAENALHKLQEATLRLEEDLLKDLENASQKMEKKDKSYTPKAHYHRTPSRTSSPNQLISKASIGSHSKKLNFHEEGQEHEDTGMNDPTDDGRLNLNHHVLGLFVKNLDRTDGD
jgi:hypothetical protein